MAVGELVEGSTWGSKKLVHITDIRGTPEHDSRTKRSAHSRGIIAQFGQMQKLHGSVVK